MAAGTYNFTIEQGTTFNRVLTLQENGSAMNLTGYSVASQIRSTHDSSTVVGYNIMYPYPTLLEGK